MTASLGVADAPLAAETAVAHAVADTTAPPPAPPRSLARLALASLPAIVDQGLFAVTNFVLSLLLARTVTPTQFGAFTLWLSVLVLLGTVYASVVIGPMLVYGTTRYADDFRGYLGGLCRAHLPLVILPSSVALVIAGGLHLAGQGDFAAYLAAMAFACPGVLLLWLGRSACFVRAGTRYLAPLAGALYLVLVLGTVQMLRLAELTGPAVLVVMGFAGLLCGAGVLVALRADVRGRSNRPRLGGDDARRFGLPSLYAAHRTFGFWLLAITVVTWLMLNAYPFLIRSFSSLADAGGFQADMNLLAPLFQGTSAICILFMPMLAAARGNRDFRRLVRSLVWLLSLAGAAFWALIVVAGDPIVRLTYGESYVARASILPVIASVCVLNAAAGVYGAALRALERPTPVFRAYLWASVVLIGAGLVLIPTWGLDGAALGTAGSWLVALLLLRGSCWTEWRRTRRSASASQRAVTLTLDLSLAASLPFANTELVPEIDATEQAAIAGHAPLFANAGGRHHRALDPGLDGASSSTSAGRAAPVQRAARPLLADATRAERALSTTERGRARVVTALLALAPVCLVLLAFDLHGAFTRGSFVRNLLPLGLLAIVGLSYLLSGQGSIVRPAWADRALLGLAAYITVGYLLRVHSGNAGESSIAIALGLLLAATHLLTAGTPSAEQCRRALRNIAWAGTLYAGTFAVVNLGLFGPEAQTFFKQMQSGILIVPFAASLLSRRWMPAAFIAATYAHGFFHYSGADTNRSAGHGGTYLAVAATAGLVYLACRGATRRARMLRATAVLLFALGAFLAVRDSAPPTSSVGSVVAVARGGNDSSSFRADVWGVAVTQIGHRPVLGGVFADSIAVTVDKYQETQLLVHNDLLQLALDGGLVATALYLFVVIDGNRRALRSYQRLRRSGMTEHGRLLLVAFTGFDSFVVVGMFNPAMFTASVSSIGFVMYALVRLLERSAPVDVPAKPRGRSVATLKVPS